MMELLSPAGSPEALRAAVLNGADAVYLGAQAFNARMGAGNFDEAALFEAADFLHERGRKLYVTVNTLVRQDEMPALCALAEGLAGAGVDAAIVQDLGVARALKSMLPDLPLHASTQMAVHNRQGVRFLKRMGFERVVLAREMSYTEIAECADEGVDLEVFAHGALCTACSGQCLFSSLVGGRSGNRGQCAQPCRMPYRLSGAAAGEGYLLSTRDLCALHDLTHVRAAGATCIKIEGRLKRPEYVAVVTDIYRRALDAPDTPIAPEDERALAQIFSRGFTRGYGPGDPDDLIGPDKPNHRGVPIGRATGHKRVWLDADVAREDGLLVRRENGEEIALRGVTGSAGAHIPLNEARAGDVLFRLAHDAQLKAARESWRVERPSVPLRAVLRARPGECAALWATDGVREASAQTGERCERAIKAADPARIREQLARTGGTPYFFTHIDIDAGDAHLPASALNRLRRDVLDALARLRIEAARGCGRTVMPLDDGAVAFHGCAPAVALRVEASDPALLRMAAQEGAEIVFAPDGGADMPGEGASAVALRVEASDPALLRMAAQEGAEIVFAPDDLTEQGLAAAGAALGGLNYALALPMVAPGAALDALHRFAHEARVAGVLASNVAHLALEWPGFIWADWGLNLFNRQALMALFELGVCGYTPSPELTAHQIRALDASGVGRELVVYGAMPLMQLRHCPLAERLGVPHSACRHCDRAAPGARLDDHVLIDRMSAAFALRRVKSPGGCIVRLLNSATLMPAPDRLPKADKWRLIFTGEPIERARAVIRAYQNGRLPDGASGTGGHYFRGVQ